MKIYKEKNIDDMIKYPTSYPSNIWYKFIFIGDEYLWRNLKTPFKSTLIFLYFPCRYKNSGMYIIGKYKIL